MCNAWAEANRQARRVRHIINRSDLAPGESWGFSCDATTATATSLDITITPGSASSSGSAATGACCLDFNTLQQLMLLQELVVRGYKADLRVQLVAPPPAADDGDQEDEGEDQEDAAAEEAAALDLEERLSDSTTSVSSPSDATSQAAARCDSHHLPFTNSLTRLVLHNVCLEGARSAVLYAVASLTALQHLDLDLSPFKGGIPGNILLHVTKLTHLGLHYGVNASTLDHIHRFQQLRQLSLGLLLPFSTSAHSQPATWQESGHCSSFRRCLFGAWFAFSPLNTPWLTSVSTGLHRLELHSVAHTQPAVLAGFSALQYLSIRGVIQSDGSRPPQNAIQAVAASEPAAGVAAGGGICMPATGWSAEAAGVWELLQVLPQLTALTHLNLPGACLGCVYAATP